MKADPSFTKEKGYHPQKQAVAAWREFLERDDISKEQKAFAWWRIGSLYAYNFDQSRGESANHEEAERAMEKVREIFSDSVNGVSLNANTIYTGLSENPRERARRLAKAFRWIATRTEEDIERGARQINRAGYPVDKKFIPSIAHRKELSLSEKKEYLRERLQDVQSSIPERVTDAIQSEWPPEVLAKLLESIEDVADPDDMEMWREMIRERDLEVQGPFACAKGSVLDF